MKSIKEMILSEDIQEKAKERSAKIKEKIHGKKGEYNLHYEFLVPVRTSPSYTEGRFIYFNIAPNSNKNKKSSSIRLNGFGNNSTPHIATVRNDMQLDDVVTSVSIYMCLLENKGILSEQEMEKEYYDILKHLRDMFTDKKIVSGMKKRKLKDRTKEKRDLSKKYDLLHQKHKLDLNRVDQKLTNRINRVASDLRDLNRKIYDDEKGMGARIRELEQHNRILLDYIRLLTEHMED